MAPMAAKRPAAVATIAPAAKAPRAAATSPAPSSPRRSVRSPAKPPVKSPGKSPAEQSAQPPCPQPWDAIIAALALQSDLQPQVLSLVREILPGTLGVDKEERHRFQTEFVQLVQGELGRVQAALEEALQTARGEVKEHSGAKAKLQETAALAQERLDEAQGLVSELSGKFAAAAEVAKAAKGAAVAAERKQEEDKLALENAARDKVVLEALSRETLEPLVSGEGLGEEARAARIQALVTALLSLGIDKAMLVSSRSALSKEPAARGAFDRITIDALQQEVQKASAAIVGLLEAGDAAGQDQAEAATSALAAAAEALDRQLEAEVAASNAEVATADARAALRGAERAVKEWDLRLPSLTAEVVSCEAKLVAFESGALADFGRLRDSLPEPTPPTEQVQNAVPGGAVDEPTPAADPEPQAAEAETAGAEPAADGPVPRSLQDGAALEPADEL